MKAKITQALVDSIEPDQSKDIYVGDERLAGLRLRVTSAGKRILYFQYRSPDGRQRKVTFGSNVEDARRKAKAAAAQVAKKEDPQAEADRRLASLTVQQAVDRY